MKVIWTNKWAIIISYNKKENKTYIYDCIVKNDFGILQIVPKWWPVKIDWEHWIEIIKRNELEDNTEYQPFIYGW